MLESVLILLQTKKNEADLIDIGKEIKEKDRIKTLATALKHFDLDPIYLRPVLRELLDRIPEQERFNMSGKHPLILKEI